MRSSRALWVTIALVTLVPLLLAVVSWFASPPILNPDSASGFIIWESGRVGAPWNSQRSPDPANISRDRDGFVTWWSPGQYVVPGWWKHAGFSWGQAMILTTLICAWIQAAGCWWLGRSVGLNSTGAAWLTVAATLQWHTLQQFGHFRGGEVLLEAAAPWLLALAWRLRAQAGLTLAVAPFLLVAALWLKLSALLLLVPLFAGLGVVHGWPFRERPAARLIWAVAFGAILLLTWWGLNQFFFQLGPTPASGVSANSYHPELIVFSFASPWLAASGLGSLIGRICWWLGVDAESVWATIAWPTLVGAALAWWAGWRWWLRPLDAPLRTAVLWMLVANVALLALLYARGSSISVEDRHLRPVATLVLLGASAAAMHSAPGPRRFAQFALALVAAFGIGAAAQRELALARLDSRGAAGFCQQQFPRPAAVHLARLDRSVPDRQALIYVPSPEIALEINRQRRLITDDLAAMRSHRWLGRVPRLIVVVRDDMERDGRGAAVRAAFADYPPTLWRAEQAGGWWFWTADAPAA